jgi:gamma-glutamyltranspeptidase/glutathione hydrolase
VWGHDVWTIPPNSQGYLTLLSSRIAEGLPLPDQPDDPLWAHLLVESSRAAAYDRIDVLHEGARAAVEAMLEDAEVERRRALLDPERRSNLASAAAGGGTMYLCAVDDSRMGVSLIQSNASNFGTYLFEPTTGIGLHNRGMGFSLTPGHPAEYGAGRRPPHTLSPALVTHTDGSLKAVIGTMGGDSQPQILVQLLARMLRNGASPGNAISAPRWVLANPASNGFDCWTAPDDVLVLVEDEAEAAWADGLRARGHEVVTMPGFTGTFGHAQVIEVVEDGLAGSADPRALIADAAGY